jgi:hypothetical protein
LVRSLFHSFSVLAKRRFVTARGPQVIFTRLSHPTSGE